MSRNSSSSVVIAGCISDPAFHRCRELAKQLQDAGVATEVDSGRQETAWEEFLAATKTRLGGDIFKVGDTTIFATDIAWLVC